MNLLNKLIHITFVTMLFGAANASGNWETNYEKAIAINSGYAKAHHNKGLALKEQGQLDEALESYDKVIRLKPDFAEAYCNKGVALEKLEQLDDIEEQAQAAPVEIGRGRV